MRSLPLTVVHVLPSAEIGPWVDVPVTEDYLAARDRRAEQVISEALRVVAEAAPSGHEIVAEHRIVSGPNVPALVDISKDAELIVVGCRGLGGLQGLLLGSVSSGLLHHSHCPVAVIHGEDPVTNRAGARVVVGIDGSPASELATAIAFEEASRRGVELVAVHTWMNHADFHVDIAWDGATAQAEEELLNASPAGTNVIPTSWFVAKSAKIIQQPGCSKSLRVPSCWWWAVTGAVASPASYWVR